LKTYQRHLNLKTNLFGCHITIDKHLFSIVSVKATNKENVLEINVWIFRRRPSSSPSTYPSCHR